MNDKMLTAEQVAEYLSVSRHTVEMWRRKKVGPPYRKIERSIRYPESEFLEWVNSRSGATAH